MIHVTFLIGAKLFKLSPKELILCYVLSTQNMYLGQKNVQFSIVHRFLHTGSRAQIT